MVSPKPHLNGGKSKPNSILGKPNSNPQQVHLHEKDDPTENQPLETSTQTMVHECLTECGTDPSDIHNVMTVFNAKGGISSQDSPRKIQVHQGYVFARANQSTPSGPQNLQHFAPCNFSSRANPKAGKKPHRPFLYSTSVLFMYTMNV